LLHKDPKDRLTGPAVLEHPWLVNRDTSTVHLGSNYVARVHHLMLRQKLKKFFLRTDVLQDQRSRQEAIDEVLSKIDGHTSTSPSVKKTRLSDCCEESDDESCHLDAEDWESETHRGRNSSSPTKSPHRRSSSPHKDSILNTPSTPSLFEEMSRKSFLFKLVDMKKSILSSLSPSPPPSACHHEESVDLFPSSATTNSELGHLLIKKSVTYSEFCGLMNGFDLAELASETVFKIFDIRNDGLIRMRDFLLTLMTFVDSLTLSRPDFLPGADTSSAASERHHPAEV
jgi:hypothetical protein